MARQHSEHVGAEAAPGASGAARRQVSARSCRPRQSKRIRPISRWYLNWNAGPADAYSLTPDDTREAAFQAGAFPLIEQSQDPAALVRTSYPAPTSLEVRSADGSGGIVLVEIFDVTDL